MVVAIFGATATGKSALALALARRVPCEIVSVDAMQVYAGVEILTNQPGADERAEVPHHLVGYLPLAETSSVGAHAPLARAAIDATAGRSALPLVVGGTGLVTRGTETFPVTSGEHAAIGLGDVHRIENPGSDELVFIEVQHGERLDENDIERIEDDYGRQ